MINLIKLTSILIIWGLIIFIIQNNEYFTIERFENAKESGNQTRVVSTHVYRHVEKPAGINSNIKTK